MVKELWKAGASGSLPPTWNSAQFELQDLKYGPLCVLPRPTKRQENLYLKAEFDSSNINSRAPACKWQKKMPSESSAPKCYQILGNGEFF